MPTFAETILDASYEGIRFPVSAAATETSHDAVEHTAYRVPGADIEHTGRAADRGTITIPFHNDLVGYGQLYPAVYQRFVEVVKSTPKGRLVHPTRGPMTALVKSIAENVTGEERDGITVTLQWVEHNASVQARPTDPNAAPERTASTALTYLADVADTAMGEVDTRSGIVAFLVSMRTIIDDALADINQAQTITSAVGTISANFRLMQEAVAERLAYEPYGAADAYDALSSLFGLQSGIHAARDVYLPPAVDMLRYVVPSEMTVFDIAQNVYGDATLSYLVTSSNPILDALAVPQGMILMLPPPPAPQ